MSSLCRSSFLSNMVGVMKCYVYGKQVAVHSFSLTFTPNQTKPTPLFPHTHLTAPRPPTPFQNKQYSSMFTYMSTIQKPSDLFAFFVCFTSVFCLALTDVICMQSCLHPRPTCSFHTQKRKLLHATPSPLFLPLPTPTQPSPFPCYFPSSLLLFPQQPIFLSTGLDNDHHNHHNDDHHHRPCWSRRRVF